jgi:hypothetical protein
MWSEVAVACATAEYNSGKMKVAIAAKELAIRLNSSRIKAAEYNGDDSGCPVTYKRVSALGFENKKFMEHVLKLQSIDFGLTLT